MVPVDSTLLQHNAGEDTLFCTIMLSGAKYETMRGYAVTRTTRVSIGYMYKFSKYIFQQTMCMRMIV